MKFALLALALLAPNFSQASSVDDIRRTWDSCLANEENQSTAGMNMCADQAYTLADKELNLVYQGAVKANSGRDENEVETLKRLKAAQRAWITFRDTNCQLQGTSMLGGSGEGPVVGGCLVSTTLDRVKELTELFGER